MRGVSPNACTFAELWPPQGKGLAMSAPWERFSDRLGQHSTLVSEMLPKLSYLSHSHDSKQASPPHRSVENRDRAIPVAWLPSSGPAVAPACTPPALSPQSPPACDILFLNRCQRCTLEM